MKTMFTMLFHSRGEVERVHFGEPETDAEIEQMYRLRFDVYVTRKGIVSGEGCDGMLEIDYLDRKARCRYIIAECQRTIIGTVRVYQYDPLPTRAHFTYAEPLDAARYLPSQMAEAGRLVSTPLQGKIIPPNLVPAGLLYGAARLSVEQDWRFVLASFRNGVVRQLERRNVPVYRITPYQCAVDRNDKDPVWGAILNAQNPGVPTYLLPDELARFYETQFEHSASFRKQSNDQYIYRPSCEELS